LIIYFSVFVVIALASNQIGKLLARLRFPLITGYLITGIIAGPFILNIISAEAIESLKFVEEVSLAVIAFAAGSELYLKEIRSQLKSITWNIVAQVVITFGLGAMAVFLLTDWIPFTRGMNLVGRGAVSLLAATILIARSPSSAIAIINELRAKGPFTKTTLGVTVMVIIFLFAFNVQVADAIFTEVGFNLRFAILLIVALILSLLAGYVVAKVFQLILSTRLDRLIKLTLILVIGYGAFEGSALLREYTHENLPFEIVLEPLLICMLASFIVINFTDHREEFGEIMHDVGPYIYVTFFTLTGDALRLDILARTWPIALALFASRLIALFIAGMVGGTLAGDPAQHRRLSWMAYITQAGVGLGLAQEVGAEFPELGSAFATTMISVIVLSQVVGPPFMKMAIRRVGESREPGQAQLDRVRDVLILGIEGQSLTLARQLRQQGWQVTIADTKKSRVDQLAPEDVTERLLPRIDKDALCELCTGNTDAVVAMLPDDNDNLLVCETAYEAGVPRVIVRLNDLARREEFAALGAYVVDPTTAMVSLLDQFVRAPQEAAQLLYGGDRRSMVQVTITDRDVTGIPLQDMRVPVDVLFLGIMRKGQSIVPHGRTVLHLNDEVTVVGSPQSLEEITLRFGF
jgi:Trk K+ transport system NAD-binding subunit/Kef-type K+ transport system membrane component KefB